MDTNVLYYVSSPDAGPVINSLYLTPTNKIVQYDGKKLRRIQTPEVFYVNNNNEIIRIKRNQRKRVIANGNYLIVPHDTLMKSINGVWFTMKEKPLFSRNFKVEPFDIEQDFQFFAVGDYVANDGQPTQNRKTGLTVSSVPFTKRSQGILDHTKFLVLTQQSFTVPDADIELFVEATMSYRSTGLTINGELAPGIRKYAAGIQSIKDEPRLSAGTLNLVDLDTGMVFDFVFSDSTIYALYEHLPVTDDTYVFTFAKAVASRPDDLTKPVVLRIGYNKFRNEVTWYIDGNPVYKVQRVGLPLVERDLYVLNGDVYPKREVKIESLAAGFGTFTLLDFFPFDESYEEIGQSFTIGLEKIRPLADLGEPYFQRMPDQLGNPVPQTEFVYEGPPEQDGQGAIITIGEFKVGLSKSPSKCYYLDRCYYPMSELKWKF